MMVSSFIGLHCSRFPKKFAYIVTPAGSYPDFSYKLVIKQAQEQVESLSMAVRKPLSHLYQVQ